MSRFWFYYVSLNIYNLSIESYYLLFSAALIDVINLDV